MLVRHSYHEQKWRILNFLDLPIYGSMEHYKFDLCGSGRKYSLIAHLYCEGLIVVVSVMDCVLRTVCIQNVLLLCCCMYSLYGLQLITFARSLVLITIIAYLKNVGGLLLGEKQSTRRVLAQVVSTIAMHSWKQKVGGIHSFLYTISLTQKMRYFPFCPISRHMCSEQFKGLRHCIQTVVGKCQSWWEIRHCDYTKLKNRCVLRLRFQTRSLMSRGKKFLLSSNVEGWRIAVMVWWFYLGCCRMALVIQNFLRGDENFSIMHPS